MARHGTGRPRWRHDDRGADGRRPDAVKNPALRHRRPRAGAEGRPAVPRTPAFSRATGAGR